MFIFLKAILSVVYTFLYSWSSYQVYFVSVFILISLRPKIKHVVVCLLLYFITYNIYMCVCMFYCLVRNEYIWQIVSYKITKFLSFQINDLINVDQDFSLQCDKMLILFKEKVCLWNVYRYFERIWSCERFTNILSGKPIYVYSLGCSKPVVVNRETGFIINV